MELSNLTSDPDYIGLPEPERAKVAEKLAFGDKDFKSLPEEEQIKVLNHLVGFDRGKPKQEPTKEEAKPGSKSIFATEAGLKSAIEEVPKVAGGLAGAGIGAEIGAAAGASLAAPLAAVTGPAAPFVEAAGTIGGALYGGYKGYQGGHAGVEKLGEFVPDSIKEAIGFGDEQRAKENAENPTAAQLGTGVVDVASLAVSPKIVNVFGGGTSKRLADMLFDKASDVQKWALTKAGDWGLKLKPSQVQEGASQSILASKHNQEIINQKVAEATGYTGKAPYIDEKFINNRFNDLGKQLDSVYSDPALGKVIRLDSNTSNNISAAIGDVEMKLPRDVQAKLDRLTSQNSGKVTKIQVEPGVTDVTKNSDIFTVNGGDFKDAMTALKRVQRNTTDPSHKYALGQLITDINDAVAKHNPAVAEKLAEINPKFRSLYSIEGEMAAKSGAIDKSGNVDAYKLGQSLKAKGQESNPLYEIGSVGESLGIGGIQRSAGTVGSEKAEQFGYGITKRLALKAGRAIPDSSAGKLIQDRARGVFQPRTKLEQMMVRDRVAGTTSVALADMMNFINNMQGQQ